jgi:hypothetical protein
MKKVVVTMFTGLVLLLAASTQARAGIYVAYCVNGTAVQDSASSCLGGTPGDFGAPGLPGALESYTGTIGSGTGQFTITGLSQSNSPGTPTLAKLLSSTLSILNITGSSQRLELFMGDTGFTSPVGPPLILNSHIGGSIITVGAGNTMSFISCVGPGNAQNPCPTSFDYMAGPGLPTINTVASYKDDQFATIAVALATPYSISQYLDIHLDGHSEINSAANTSLTTVPEPLSIALLGGILVLSSGLIRRKTKRESAV